MVAAHFNHRLRGDSSNEDQRFVESLCRSCDIPLAVGAAEVSQLADAQGDGLEAAARAARYEFLTAAARRFGARYILTAHTADDQAETILHRLLRGTGLNGLAGIPRRRELGDELTIVRPLLDCRRAQVIEYLSQLGQDFRDDETNDDLNFTRNRLRHELLEHLRETYNPQVSEALLRVGTLAAEAHDVVRQLVAELLPHCVTTSTEHTCSINGRLLKSRPRYLIRELLIGAWRAQGWPEQAMGFAEWDLLAEMLMAPVAELAARKRMFPGSVTARRVGEQLQLERPAMHRQ
jgi:tRNA(Ile)-lysidine synthase